MNQRIAQHIGQKELRQHVALLLVHQIHVGKRLIAHGIASVLQIKVQMIKQPEMSRRNDFVGKQRIHFRQQGFVTCHLLFPVRPFLNKYLP